MSGPNKKGMSLEKKHNVTGWGLPDSGNSPDLLDEFLSHDQSVHYVNADRYWY